MSFWLGLLVVAHIIVSLLLIGVVLIQRGEGGSLMSAFASQSQTVFGSQAIDMFVKATWILGGLFFLLSIILATAFGAGMGAGRSVIGEDDKPPVSAPASVPAPATAPVEAAPSTPTDSAPAAPAAPAESAPAPK